MSEKLNNFKRLREKKVELKCKIFPLRALIYRIFILVSKRQMHRAQNISAPRNVGHKFMTIETYTHNDREFEKNKFINSIKAAAAAIILTTTTEAKKCPYFNPC